MATDATGKSKLLSRLKPWGKGKSPGQSGGLVKANLPGSCCGCQDYISEVMQNRPFECLAIPCRSRTAS